MAEAEPLARFRSSKEEVVYEVAPDLTCTCPGFLFRKDCSHVKAVKRLNDWGVEIVGILPPPVAWEVVYEQR